LSEVCAKETCLHGIGLLAVPYVLVARSPAASVPSP
jgi:hypothetical protein